MTESEPIPLRRARLPTAEDILPYLRAIDEAGQYSNFGPLNRAFEERLAAHLGVAAGTVLTTCNATAGLALALRECAAPGARYCVLPAFTFPATPAAAVEAGLEPLFADIDAESLTLQPEAAEALVGAGYEIGAVQPVSPFGRPVNTADWEAFSERTGIPVVIDAAWCFDSLRPSWLPQVLSLHATKVLGIGEGGAVVSSDIALLERLRRSANFAFDADRRVLSARGNAKLSEYGAAVGMAALDAWPARREALAEIHRAYGEGLADHDHVERVFTEAHGEWVTATVAIELADADAHACAAAMAREGVEARAWWGTPCHRHPAYARSAAADLTNTEATAARILNLPMADDMARHQVERVVATFERALAALPPHGTY